MNQQADGQAGGRGTGPALFELWAELRLRAHIGHPAAPSRRGWRRQLPAFITGMSSESNRQVLIKH